MSRIRVRKPAQQRATASAAAISRTPDPGATRLSRDSRREDRSAARPGPAAVDLDGWLRRAERLGHSVLPRRTELGPTGTAVTERGSGPRPAFEPVRASLAEGSPVIQRMIAIGRNLYFNRQSLPKALQPFKEASPQLQEWRQKISDRTGKTMVDMTTEGLIGRLRVPRPNKKKIRKRLNHHAAIYEYDSLFTFKQNHGKADSDTSIELLLQPEDILEGESDLQWAYERGKACVLQALVNAGISKPEEMDGSQDDPKDWHDYYFKEKRLSYTDTYVMLQIYEKLGLSLIWNKRVPWSRLPAELFKPEATYIFSMPGHNFAVEVNKEWRAEKRFSPRDVPQNRITSYQPDQEIQYVFLCP